MELVWRNIVLMSFVHLSGIYGFYLAMFYAQIKTVLFMISLVLMSSFGVQVNSVFKLELCEGVNKIIVLITPY